MRTAKNQRLLEELLRQARECNGNLCPNDPKTYGDWHMVSMDLSDLHSATSMSPAYFQKMVDETIVSGTQLLHIDGWFRVEIVNSIDPCEQKCLAFGWMMLLYRLAGLKGLQSAKDIYRRVMSGEEAHGCDRGDGFAQSEGQIWKVFVRDMCRSLDDLYGTTFSSKPVRDISIAVEIYA